MEKPADKKHRNMKMRDINKHLDPKDPSHAIVIAINKRNTEQFGPIHECGLFENFCRCENKKENGREESEAA